MHFNYLIWVNIGLLGPLESSPYSGMVVTFQSIIGTNSLLNSSHMHYRGHKQCVWCITSFVLFSAFKIPSKLGSQRFIPNSIQYCIYFQLYSF